MNSKKKKELLQPSRACLYSLYVRFRYVDKQLEDEKRRKNLIGYIDKTKKLHKSGENRHRIPDELRTTPAKASIQLSRSAVLTAAKSAQK